MSGFPWGAFGLNTGVAAAVSLAVMLTAFAYGAAVGLHRVVDVAWGLAFAAVAITSYALAAGRGDGGGGSAHQVLLTALTVVWGLRLAAHLAWRGRGKGEDARYARMLGRSATRRPWLRALRMVYLPQAALAWFISLPVQAGQYADGPLSGVAVAGAALWAAGLFFEAVGDFQLARFTADPANRGRIMDRGLWRYTRHPHYFGDFCVWWGLFLVAADMCPAVLVTVPAPSLMSWLLIWGSGKRLLERHLADRPGYAEYAARTSGFFPRPPRPRATVR